MKEISPQLHQAITQQIKEGMFISVPSFYDTFLVFLNASYEANYASFKY